MRLKSVQTADGRIVTTFKQSSNTHTHAHSCKSCKMLAIGVNDSNKLPISYLKALTLTSSRKMQHHVYARSNTHTHVEHWKEMASWVEG